MSKNRIKLSTPVVRDRDHAEMIVGEIATITINKVTTTAARDKEIAAITESYAGNLSAIDEQLAQKTTMLKAWSEANPDEFKGKKSIDFGLGVIGFRTGTPKLKTRRKLSFEKILEAMCLNRGFWSSWIRTKEEVDKEGILNSFSKQELDAAVLYDIGLEVVQDESFFVDPKLTDVEKRQTQKESKAVAV